MVKREWTQDTFRKWTQQNWLMDRMRGVRGSKDEGNGETQFTLYE